MHPFMAELIADLHKQAKSGDLSTLSYAFRKAFGAVGKRNFLSQVGYLPVYSLIFERDPELFKQFLENVRPEQTYLDKHNNNMFHHYVLLQRYSVLKSLMETGILFNSVNCSGKTPIHLLIEDSYKRSRVQKVEKAYADLVEYEEFRKCFTQHQLGALLDASPLSELGPPVPWEPPVEVDGETEDDEKTGMRKRADLVL